MTNGEWIRSRPDEELAGLLLNCSGDICKAAGSTCGTDYCDVCALKWLKMEHGDA